MRGTLARRLLEGEFAPEVIDRVVTGALNFPVPLRPLGEGLWLLELFHGPTLAFKDFGARFLARLFGEILREDGDYATVLVATSGDTGSAVARGFAGVPGTRVVVLYPAGKVSPFQEAQMATIGGNVTAVRVAGVFDDCQRLVKSALAGPGPRAAAAVVGELDQHRPAAAADVLLRSPATSRSPRARAMPWSSRCRPAISAT